MKKATFGQRLLAYLIDACIVLIISSMVTSSFSTKKLESLQKDLEDVVTNYTQGEISMDEYLEQTKDLSYEMEKSSTTTNIVYVVISIGYFIVFQYLNKGQTLGKKLMKIRIVNQEEKEPNIIQMILRTCITNEILPKILIIIFVTFVSKNNFLSIYSVITVLTYAFIIITVFMILYRKDKLGLNDIIAKTKVVKEGR